MTTKLREGMIRLSRNERKRKWTIGLALILVIAMFFLALSGKKIIVEILALLALLLLFISEVLDAINKQKDEVIAKNKLINIVLSETSAVEKCFEYLVFLPGIFVLCKFFEINLFVAIIMGIGSAIAIVKVSKIISRHFENKLSKE